MWRLYGRPGKDVCDQHVGITRRDVLRVGGAGMLGMTLGQLLRLQAAAEDAGIARRAWLGQGQERHHGVFAGRAQPSRLVGPQARRARESAQRVPAHRDESSRASSSPKSCRNSRK